LRNDAFCVRCGSISRNRHLALTVLDLLRERGIRSLRDLAARSDVSVWHTAARGSIARALRGPDSRVTFTEFADDVAPGTSRDGVECQDLQALTFERERFDLAISEDVLEHVPDYAAAFRELHRVLKPGGAHVFTVPYYPDETTQAMFEKTKDGWQPRGPVEYHDDPDRGRIATYTRFGSDLPRLLEAAGFETNVRSADAADIQRAATFDSVTFVAGKMTPGVSKSTGNDSRGRFTSAS
jgi:SAM-dependent methyltransferase